MSGQTMHIFPILTDEDRVQTLTGWDDEPVWMSYTRRMNTHGEVAVVDRDEVFSLISDTEVRRRYDDIVYHRDTLARHLASERTHPSVRV